MKDKKGIGTFVNMEWLIPVMDYYRSLRKNELVLEVVIPICIGLICSTTYLIINKLVTALNGIANIMPTAISILIGFTVMLLTLLLTSSGDNIKVLKEHETDRKLHNTNITLFQLLYIHFSHSLFTEIFLLLLIFFYLFVYGIGMPFWMGFIILLVEIYFTLNILFSILRGITNLYFSFFK